MATWPSAPWLLWHWFGEGDFKMRSKARPLLAASVAALLIATLMLIAGDSKRDAWLKETGQTRRAV